jgi:hypothetical protein
VELTKLTVSCFYGDSLLILTFDMDLHGVVNSAIVIDGLGKFKKIFWLDLHGWIFKCYY